jgi:hypothetical protein
MPSGLVGGSGCLGVIGDDPRRMGIGAGRCLLTGWWTGRPVGGMVMGDQGPRGGRPWWVCRTTLASASAPGRARRGVPAAAGAGRWMRSSRAPGPARSGCGTRRAAGESCAAPTPLIRPHRPGGDRGGSLRPSRPRPSSSTTARDLAALQARPGGRGLGAARTSRCDGAVLERSGRGAATCSAGHVDHGDDGALGLVPGRDHLRCRQQLHLAAVAL